MYVPTVSELLNNKAVEATSVVTEADVSTHCYCCGADAPLSLARIVTKSDHLFYRCGTCEEALIMVSPSPNDMPDRSSESLRLGEWTIHPIAPISVNRAWPMHVAGHG